eukprot:SAG11_NODE_9_length_28972_cov_81.532539_6_plen_115_part_00
MFSELRLSHCRSNFPFEGRLGGTCYLFHHEAPYRLLMPYCVSGAAANGNGRVLVATDVAARGLDVPNIDVVVVQSLSQPSVELAGFAWSMRGEHCLLMRSCCKESSYVFACVIP